MAHGRALLRLCHWASAIPEGPHDPGSCWADVLFPEETVTKAPGEEEWGLYPLLENPRADVISRRFCLLQLRLDSAIKMVVTADVCPLPNPCFIVVCACLRLFPHKIRTRGPKPLLLLSSTLAGHHQEPLPCRA